MGGLTFERPVVVIVGSGFPRQVDTTSEAYDFLLAWPQSRREALYGVAKRACEAAREGHVTAEQARRAFERLCSVAGILAPDAGGSTYAVDRQRVSHSA